MGYYWQTIIFFLLREEWPTDLVEDVLTRLAEAKIVFQRMGDWYGLNGDRVEHPSLSEVIDLCAQYKGGLLEMGYYGVEDELEMDSNLTFRFCGELYVSLDNAAGAFGSILLTAHCHYITTSTATDGTGREYVNNDEDTKRHLELIYTASRILAETPGAIYGVGDHDYQLEYVNAVPTRSLQNWEIPRLAWWSFYNKEYCERLGQHRLFAASTWHGYEIENGLITIAHPPTEPD